MKELQMPLVKVSMLKGRPLDEKNAISASIQAALVAELKVPNEDFYQLFSELDADDFRHTNAYLGLEYTDRLLVIEITIIQGRNDEIKKAILARIDENLVAAGVARADDVFVMITEIGAANVSFGRGIAQRAAVATIPIAS
jgi:phenylpyruvate tautomerase PptA (4-oxalocrotonate tautomerase family)